VTFTTELTIDDYRDFLRMLGTRPSERAGFLFSHLFLLVVAPFLIYSFGLFVMSLVETWQNGRMNVLLGDPIVVGLVVVCLLLTPIAFLWLRRTVRQLIRAPSNAKVDSLDESSLRDGFDLGQLQFEVLSDGLRIAMPLGEERYLWPAFQDVRETDRALFLMHDERSGEILPKRAFADEQAFEGFKTLAEQKIGSAI
jgi:hypothetical protein